MQFEKLPPYEEAKRKFETEYAKEQRMRIELEGETKEEAMKRKQEELIEFLVDAIENILNTDTVNKDRCSTFTYQDELFDIDITKKVQRVEDKEEDLGI